jgi:hypothetical protein
VRAKPVVLKGINRIKKRQANGTIKIYLYHRATGLPLDPNNLVASYAAAEKTKKVASQDTLTHLIHVFDSSTYFDGLSETSRREYVWKLKRIEHRWVAAPCRHSTMPMMHSSFARMPCPGTTRWARRRDARQTI